MLFNSILAEWLKLRHSRIWLILGILPILSILIGSANYYFNQAVLTKEWYSLWTQVSLFYGEFFFPVLIAIFCAFVCRLEHLNRNWNAVMTTPISTFNIFIAKLITVSFFMLFVQLFFLFLYFCAGKFLGITSPFPNETIGWIIRGWLASISLSSIQLLLSLRIRSFAIPIGITICCVFAGLGFYVMKLGMFFPFSLLTIGMGVISQEGLTASQSTLFLVMNCLFITIFSMAAIRRLQKTDVVTN